MPSKRQKEQTITNSKKLDKWFSLIVRIFVLAIFIVHPLIITPNTYYTIVDTKRIFFTSVFVATCAALLVLALLAGSMAPGYLKWPGWRGIAKKIRSYEWALLAYWLVILISAILSEYSYYSFMGSQHNNEGLLMQSAYLLTVVIIGRLYQENPQDLFWFCLSSAIVSIIGIFQFYGFDFITPMTLRVYLRGPHLTMLSTMSNRNIFSTYLCLTFCVGAVLWIKNTGRKKWFYLIHSGIVFYMLILANTRSGYVALALSSIVFMRLFFYNTREVARLLLLFGGCFALVGIADYSYFVCDWDFSLHVFTKYIVILGILMILMAFCLMVIKKHVNPKVLLHVLLAAIIIIAVMGILFILFSNNTYTAVIREIFSGNINESLGSNRIFVWRRTMNMVGKRPIFGYGPDSFYFQYGMTFGEETSQTIGVSFDKTHNEYLQVLFDTGILGLAGILSFYGLTLVRATKQTSNVMVLALLFALFAYLIQAFFNFSTPIAHPVVWMLWGMLANLIYRENIQH